MWAFRLHEPAAIEQAPLRREEIEAPCPGPGEVLVASGPAPSVGPICTSSRASCRCAGRPSSPVTRSWATWSGWDRASRASPPGTRVGIAWLHGTCGLCRFCQAGRENLCEAAAFTGWTVDGGFAELTTARADFVYPLPAELDDRAAAPLLCAGIIGFRALELTGLGAGWAGARLGLYGFGAAGHVAIQIARGRGAEVYVATRDRSKHQTLAAELGATWVGDAIAAPPRPLDAAVVFAPAGELVPAALSAVGPGGVVVLGGIDMSDIPALPYQLLYRERVLRTVANNTRADGHAFLAEAARLGVRHPQRALPVHRRQRGACRP